MNAHTIICTNCGVERTLKSADSTNRFIYAVLIGKCEARCKSCSVIGRTYLGRKNPGNDGATISKRMKGNSYAKGFHGYSPEERERRRQVMLGNKFNLGRRGADNPSWRGGLGTERHQAMGQIEYKAWRDAVFLRDNYTCQICDQYGGYLHADHIKPWKDAPELRYDPSNGRTLCVACHYYVTFKRKMPEGLKWAVTRKRG